MPDAVPTFSLSETGRSVRPRRRFLRRLALIGSAFVVSTALMIMFTDMSVRIAIATAIMSRPNWGDAAAGLAPTVPRAPDCC